MIDLTAIPTGHGYLVDCTECGPLGIVDRVILNTYAYQHLASHGVDVPTDEPTCECGYNYLHPTGDPGDTVRCLDCTWVGAGAFADHAAHHHYLDTSHTWELTMGTKT